MAADARDLDRVVVVGAGAGGLLAAGRAAECGAEVVLLERGPRTGRKLRICGKGRANITNIAAMPDFISAFGDNGKFLYGAFSRFFNSDLTSLLDRLGVPSKTERGGRVFPVSDSADQVADTLERWCRDSGVDIRPETRISDVLADAEGVTGVRTGENVIGCGAAVLATGGITYPATGSSGDGYRMAARLGHTIIQPRPAVTAMNTVETWPRRMQGLSLRNVEARLEKVRPDGSRKLLGKQQGEMLFTHFGVSGPIILTLSRKALEHIGAARLELRVDLKPALSEEQLNARLLRDLQGRQHFGNYLKELLPRKMIPVFVELSGLPWHVPVNSITSAQRKQVIGLLRDIRLTVRSLRPPEEAIVTAGGVDIREIDPRTMESRKVLGLYLVGEVIDVDATTGGYNLQAAFSTGWVAGEAAARRPRLIASRE